MEPLSGKLRRVLVGQVLSKLVSAAIGVATTAILVHYLNRAEYGQVSAGLAFGALFAGLNDPGLNQIVLRRQPRPGPALGELVRRSLGLSMTLSFAGAVVACGVALVLFSGSGEVITFAALLSCAALLPNGLAAAYLPLYQARLRLWPVAVGDLATRAVLLVLIGAVVLLHGGAVAAAAAIAGAQVTNAAVLGAATGKRQLRPVIDLRTWSSLLRESAPLGLALGVYSIYVKLDIILIERLGSPAALANYALAYRVIDVVTGVLVVSMFAITGPLTAGAMEDAGVLARRVTRLRNNFLVAGALLSIAGSILAPLAVRLLAGSSAYSGASLPLSILVVATAFSGMQAAYNTTLAAIGQSRRLLPLMAVLLLLNVAANLAAIPALGASGAAAVTLGTEVASVWVASRWVRHLVAIPRVPIRLSLFVGAAGVVTGVILIVR